MLTRMKNENGKITFIRSCWENKLKSREVGERFECDNLHLQTLRMSETRNFVNFVVRCFLFSR